MSIRRGRLPADRFTQISNQWMRDKRLTWHTRGLIAWLAGHDVGFRVSERTIIASGPAKRDAVRAMIREAEQYGYLVREQRRTGGGTFSETSYILQDPWTNPQAGTDDGKPVHGKRGNAAGDAKAQFSTDDGYPVDGPIGDGEVGGGSTCENSGNPQVTTVDGSTVDGEPTPIRRTTEKKTKEKNTIPGLLAVGEGADRNARATATTPPAKSSNLQRLAGQTLAAMPEHYNRAPAWLRSRILRKITAAIEAGHTPPAIATYAHKFTGDPSFGTYEHLRRFDDVIRKLTTDVADGAACATCGRDPAHAWCQEQSA